jgi:serine/threonine protein kinase
MQNSQIIMTGGGTNLISQGTYGCIFRPGFHCNGRAIHSDKYITKIQRKKGTSDHEAEIAEIIRKIPHFDDYFAPILEKPCLINMASIQDNEIKKCDFLKTIPKKQAPFESNKIKYVGKHTLADLLLDEYHRRPKTIIKKMVESYVHLLNGYKKLNDGGVIHFDVKENNVMCEDITKKPIIIDFGLSINVNKMKMENLNDIFFVYGPDYGPWTIEITVLSYIVQEIGSNWKTQTITKEMFQKILSDFISQNYGVIDLLNDTERRAYHIQLSKFFSKYVNKTGLEVVTEMLKYKQTWDNYAVAVIYLYIIKDMHLNEYIEDSVKIKAYVDYLKYILICMPDKRPEIPNSTEHVLAIFKHADRKEEKMVQQKIHTESKEKKHIVRQNIAKTQEKHRKFAIKIYKSKQITSL